MANTESIEDLTPYQTDRCWMFVLLARQANVGVIVRRGPTDWWNITRWDTVRDEFEPGQWFRGRIYPGRSDLSPDGRLFIYFAGKFRPNDQGYTSTWTAVSRPPYLTALALWPIGDTWGGEGVFLDNQTVLIATSTPSFGARHHPNHPPGPLRVMEYCSLPPNDPRRQAVPCTRQGWQGIVAPRQTHRGYPNYSAWRKTMNGVTLERDASQPTPWGLKACEGPLPSPSRQVALYTLYRRDGSPVALFEAQWADWDQQGRLVATVGGRVLTGNLLKDGRPVWRQLASLHQEQPARKEAPDWARHW